MVKMSVFVLIVIGTLGLLLNELVFDWGRVATIIFAICNLVGLAALAWVTWRTKNKN